MNNRRLVLLISVGLVLLTVGAYWQVTGYGFLNFDDDDYVTANPLVRAGLTPGGAASAFVKFHEGYWHPLTWISLMLDCSLFGLKAGGYHVVALLLHIASTILLFLVLRRMTGCMWRSAFVAVLFAIHPLHVESVAWVAERKDVLSTFFLMLTLLAYARYAERPNVTRYLTVAAALACGLMSKPMLVTLPFVLLLLDFWPLRRLDPSRSPSPTGLVLEKIPLIAMTLVSAALTFIAQRGVMAVGSNDQYPTGVRIANALVAYVTYLVKMIWPAKLCVFYPHPGTGLPTWQVIGSAVFLLGVTALVICAARTRPYLAVGWFWYLITPLPVIGIVQVGMQSMADRYTYIPLVGAFVALTWGVSDIFSRTGETKKGRTADFTSPIRPLALSPILAILVLAALAPLTWRQVGYWHDSKTLFSHALAITKNNAVAENNLGIALAAENRLDEAIRHHRCAVDYKPGWADAHYSLAAALSTRGQTPEAIEEFEKTLAIDGRHAQAHNGLGAALMQTGNLRDAIGHFKQAVAARPEYAQAWNNLGTALSFQGKLDESVKQFAKASQIDPSFADSHYNLAIGLGQQNHIREAIAECRKALALKPNWPEAQNNLAWFLATVPTRTHRDAQEAVKLAEKVCRSTGNANPEYLDTLAAAYESAGRHEDAIRTAQRALALAKSKQTAH